MKSRLEKVYSKLPNQKVNLKAHKVALGVADDLEDAVSTFTSGTFETANKVVDIAIKVNNILNNVTDDVRYYNDYAKITYDDLGRHIDYVQELMDKASAAADELGIDEQEIRGFNDAKNFLIDAQSLSGYMTTHTLDFDI
jgi:hypothetical protein